MFLQMRNALEEKGFMPQGDVIEQDQVLMDLSHISYVGNDPQAKFPSQ